MINYNTCLTLFTGKKVLPDVNDLAEKLFLRDHFKPDIFGSNMLFAHYAQQLSYQLFMPNKFLLPGYSLVSGLVSYTSFLILSGLKYVVSDLLSHDPSVAG